MGKKKTLVVGVVLLVTALALAGASYATHRSYMEAWGRTISLPPGFTGPLTDDTPVQVQVFGAKQSAADQAKTNRNILILTALGQNPYLSAGGIFS